MNILTTPLERFENLPDYPFSANYIEVEPNLKMHYLDEGNPSGEVVLLLHGEPSWSYLYRFMIPPLVEAGFKVLAPDLIGFGKSDKPAAFEDYTYANHLSWVKSWIDQIGLSDINLFCQDWGGLIGLRLAAENQDLFKSIVAANTGLPTGDVKIPEAFMKWLHFSKKVDVLPVSMLLQNATVRKLSANELAAYDAPFPDGSYQAGAKIFPSLVPITTEDPEAKNNKRAWELLSKFNKPFLTLFSDQDPITKGGERPLQKIIPGAQNQDHQIMLGGGHFLQEDIGPLLAERMIKFIKGNAQ
jgi:haloalkane dehalogenase